MEKEIKRIYVEKKSGFDIEARELLYDFKENLEIKELKSLKVILRYDILGLKKQYYEEVRDTIFSESATDNVHDDIMPINKDLHVFAIEYLPGQYDQRSDCAEQFIQILTKGIKPKVKVAKLIILEGGISAQQLEDIKQYYINPVESREVCLDKPKSYDADINIPKDVKIIDGFIKARESELNNLINDMGFAMDIDDLKFCQSYFRDVEKRDATITEMRMIDTYWSDHCRHTTFLTKIEQVDIEKSKLNIPVENAYKLYLDTRDFVYKGKNKEICLMDIATMGMKELKKRGMLDDLDESDEINACSIVANVDIDGKQEEWLIMFKNETHNHPTEIEPFGGASTCLGGAIRDPLSGRSYVYQAMRVTGCGDSRTSIGDTLPGKLPQRKITIGAAKGYSSYGNQIGIAAGQVSEIYHPGYIAKRMELGAVVAAVPKENVKRAAPIEGDVVILLGGKTGRDGCGGATGSSKAHTDESLEEGGPEVQKGNPPEERKIQRFFRDSKVSTMIKKCNDFGAGGVSVAIGELADGLEINLDAVPTKYQGLDGTELAISESQERMAVVISKTDVDLFISMARKENLEATVVAVVTKQPRLKIFWRNKIIVDISRAFLDSNGAPKTTNVAVKSPNEKENYFHKMPEEIDKSINNIKVAWLKNLQNLNICSQKGLIEMFDSTVGASTIIAPLGGKYQLTPAEGMVSKIPVLDGQTNTATIMSYGYNPNLSKWSPFHGAVYAVIEAVAKITAMGGDYRKIRLSLQEFFEKPDNNPERWGKPFSALLGAYYTQSKLGIPAIGGKDSMSGTFNDMDVPPTLVAFAIDLADADKIISPEFKKINSKVILIKLNQDEHMLPDFEQLEKEYTAIYNLIQQNNILSSHSVTGGGLVEVVSKMCFGNKIGFAFQEDIDINELFLPLIGSIVIEIDENKNIEEILKNIDYKVLGCTQKKQSIIVDNCEISLSDAIEQWEKPLESIFPTKMQTAKDEVEEYKYERKSILKRSTSIAKPKVFMPVFPDTNGDYDMAKAFENAGGLVDMFIFKNLTLEEIEESLDEMIKRIKKAQIIALPGGFSGGEGPEGSGLYGVTAFKDAKVTEVVMELLQNRDGLMLGIGSGFQTLIKLGLLPYGNIGKTDNNSPLLTFNTIGRYVSSMVTTKVTSNLSPWFNNVKVGEMHTLPISHGKGRFIANDDLLEQMNKNGQIATQYVDFQGNPTYDIRHNPNGSVNAIESITSPDGRILGKMTHSERIGENIIKNIPGNKEQNIFEAAITYFE